MKVVIAGGGDTATRFSASLDATRSVFANVTMPPEQDLDRVAAARDAIGPEAELFVDGNGAYDRKEALAKAAEFADLGVTWCEEPVASDDVRGFG